MWLQETPASLALGRCQYRGSTYTSDLKEYATCTRSNEPFVCFEDYCTTFTTLTLQVLLLVTRLAFGLVCPFDYAIIVPSLKNVVRPRY